MSHLSKAFGFYNRTGERRLPDDVRVARIASVSREYLAVYSPTGDGILLDELPKEIVDLAADALEACRELPGATCSDEFEHDLDLSTLDGLSAEQRQKKLVEHFWGNINPNLSEPLLADYEDLGEGADGSIDFVTGDADEFARLIRLFVLTDPEADPTITTEVAIQAEFEGASSGIPEDAPFYTDRFHTLVDVALELHQPVGGEYEYNDGASDRTTGYDPSPACIRYDIDPPSAHERLEAIPALAAWIDGLPDHLKTRLAKIRKTLNV